MTVNYKRLNQTKSNVRIIETSKKILLFSYDQLVAYFDKDKEQYFQTTTKWSVTTSKHIKEFFQDLLGLKHSAFNVNKIDQSELDKLLNKI